jgi:hypothetical protein
MMNASRLIVAGAALALLPLSAALAQSPTTTPDEHQPATQSAPAPETAPAPQSKGATFESLDTNGDGRISKTEAEANESVKSQFSHYDVNGDGYIERAEVVKANTPPSTPQQ